MFRRLTGCWRVHSYHFTNRQPWDWLWVTRVWGVTLVIVAISGVSLVGCGGASVGPESQTTAAPAMSAAARLQLSGAAPTTVVSGQSYDFQPKVSASGSTSTTVTFTVANKPAWTLFDATSGRLYGTPTDADVGAYKNIDIEATSGANSADLPAFSITVVPAESTTGSSLSSLSSVTISWEAPTQNSDGSPLVDLRGYNLYYGSESRSYSKTVNIANPGLTTYVLDDLSGGTYYFALTAYNSAGVESALSAEVSASLE